MMERSTNSQDTWEHVTWEDERSPVLKYSNNESIEEKHESIEGKYEGPQARSESLYQKYGTNEPYTKPENMDHYWNLENFFEYVCKTLSSPI